MSSFLVIIITLFKGYTNVSNNILWTFNFSPKIYSSYPKNAKTSGHYNNIIEKLQLTAS